MSAPLKPWQRQSISRTETPLFTHESISDTTQEQPLLPGPFQYKSETPSDLHTPEIAKSEQPTDSTTSLQPSQITSSENTISPSYNHASFFNNYSARSLNYNYNPRPPYHFHNLYDQSYSHYGYNTFDGYNSPMLRYNGYNPDPYGGGFNSNYGTNWIDHTADSLGRFTQILEINSYFFDQLIELGTSLMSHLSAVKGNLSRIPLPSMSNLTNNIISYFFTSYEPEISPLQNSGKNMQNADPFFTLPENLKQEFENSEMISTCSENNSILDQLNNHFNNISAAMLKLIRRVYINAYKAIFTSNRSLPNEKKHFKFLLTATFIYLLFGIYSKGLFIRLKNILI